MSPLELKQIFPDWYKEWLFLGLGIKDGEETSEKYLKPLFRLNQHWLAENYEQQDYSWDAPEVATSYALYYMTINMPKLWIVLNNSGVWPKRELKSVNSIVEFGCGPGTFLWSYLFYLHATAPEQVQKIEKIRGVDTSPTNLKIAQKLFRALTDQKVFAHIKAEFICGKWEEHFDDKSYHLGIFGNSLVESSDDLGFIENCYANLLIMEPGTLRSFQKLRVMRDALIAQDWHIHFPCCGGTRCPMSDDNWCHFHVNRFLLPFIQKMSNAAKRQNHRHNFTAFLFSRHSNQLTQEDWRILSAPRKVKRTVMRYICDGERMFEAVLGRRNRSDSNREFIDLEPGSIATSSSCFHNKRLHKDDSFLNKS